MNAVCERTEETRAQSLELVGNQSLVVTNEGGSSVLRIIGRDGKLTLAIHVNEDGPVVRLESSAIEINAQGALALDAEHVAIHGRKGVALTSDGDMRIDAATDLESRARSHRITAKLGNVDIRANDDVTMDGERIKMNC